MRTRAWLRYNQEDGRIDITIRDASGGKIEIFKFRKNDFKSMQKALWIIYRKHGVKISLKEEKDKDIDWLKKDFDYL